MICFNHNLASLSAIIFQESSPIIDIEHTYLYNPSTIRRLFSLNQYSLIKVKPTFNYVSLRHLIRLIPLSTPVKSRLLSVSWLQRINLFLPLGNIICIAQKPQLEANISAFNRDVATNHGYRYTTNSSLSSNIANQRLTKATLTLLPPRSKKLIDIGCGDGTYTHEVFRLSNCQFMLGLDPAKKAIAKAKSTFFENGLEFRSQSAYELTIKDQTYDVAILRGVLHHLDRPQLAIAQSLRVAKTAIIIEPNGYNPVLKILEKISPYHRRHDEKSYSASKLDSWITASGGQILEKYWLGLVPFFCPSFLAKILKKFEPFVESLPLLNRLCCAVYVVKVQSNYEPNT